MGINERKTREREDRKNLIREITKQLIVEKGVDSFTMLDIAKKCELSKATLYLYFSSKEAILEEIIDEAGSYFISFVEARMNGDISGIEAIRTLWMSYITIYGESSDIFVMFGIKNYISPGYPLLIDESEGAANRPPVRLYRMIAQVLERGVADGTLDASIDPSRVARTVIMISAGIIDNIARLPAQMRNTRLIIEEMRSTFEIVLRGLASSSCDRARLTLADNR
jgi:AcrR family transcriptional regulator